MAMLRKEWSEEDITRLSYDMAIARAKVYKKWGFDINEIAALVDLPESKIRAVIDDHSDVRCVDCRYLEFSDLYGECSIGYKGIVWPNDSCGRGEPREEKE